MLTCLILAWPASPTQDTPLWAYEARLLSDALHGVAADGCRLVSALPPNALAQGALALLMQVVDQELACRLYLAGCVCALVAAIVYLCRARDPAGRSAAPLWLLPLCAGYPFFHGFLNYLAALPVLAFGLAELLRNPEGRGARGALVLGLLPSLAYLCHGTALGVWGVLVAVQLWVRRSPSFGVRAALGFVPVAVLLWLYVAQRSAEGALLSWSAGSLGATALYRLRSPLRFFSVFQGLTPTFDDPLLGWVAAPCVIVNLFYTLGLAALCIGWAVRTRRSQEPGERMLALSVLALGVAFVILPHDAARMLNPAERLLMPLALCGGAGLACSRQLQRRWLPGALLGAQLAYVALFGTRAAVAAREVAELRARELTFTTQAQEITGAAVPRTGGWVSLLTRHQVLAMQGILQATQRGQVVIPFATGLFRCHAPPGEPHDLHGLLQSEQGFILLGESAQRAALLPHFAATFRVAQTGPGFALLQPLAAKLPLR